MINKILKGVFTDFAFAKMLVSILVLAKIYFGIVCMDCHQFFQPHNFIKISNHFVKIFFGAHIIATGKGVLSIKTDTDILAAFSAFDKSRNFFKSVAHYFAGAGGNLN